jgi:hypothetical protein
MNHAKPTPLLLLPLLLLLSGCPWALDHPDDPYRCVPACNEGQICKDGECVKGTRDGGGGKEDRGQVYMDGGAGQCKAGFTKCETANIQQYCEDGTIYKRACNSYCDNKNQENKGCRWVSSAAAHICVCQKRDAGPDTDNEV